MSKRDAGAGGGRAWCSYVAAVAVGAAVLLLLRMTSLPASDMVRDFITISLGASNATAVAAISPQGEVLLDPPNLMVPAPRDPAKTAAAKVAKDAMRAKMKKDFEDQWAALAPAEQAAMRKQWKEDWLRQQAEEKRRKAERAARREAASNAQGSATARRMLRGALAADAQ